MNDELKKLSEYAAVFGEDNVRLVFYVNGSGCVEIGTPNIVGFFIDSFENVTEFLKKDPKETHRKAKEWNWI